MSFVGRKFWHVRPQIFIFAAAILAAAVGFHSRPAMSQASIDTPEPIKKRVILVKKTVVPPNCAVVNCIALTFDDGPDSHTTAQLLDILDKEQIKATFFLVGNRIASNATVIQRMSQTGYEIGNHSWSHPRFDKLTSAQWLDQINMTQNALTQIGVPPAKYFRPPYGERPPRMVATVPLPVILWNIDPKDWATKDPNLVVASIKSQLKPGGIIVMHDAHQSTVDALVPLLKELKADNYYPVSAGELLNIQPGTHGEFFAQPK